jgi:hypothetical protein
MLDLDPGFADGPGRTVHRGVWTAGGDLVALVETAAERAAAEAEAAMERFFERMRPTDNSLLPTGFTLHQSRLLRASAPAEAHVFVGEGESLAAALPERARMRLFELMFGEQFSLEVLDHAVNEKPAPRAARRAPGFRPGGAEPREGRFAASETLHHAFAKIRLTLHLGFDQRRYFDGVGMAQDAVREAEAAVAELQSSRRSGRDGIGDAWRSAVERISPVFRPAYERGSEALERARSLLARPRAVEAPALAAAPDLKPAAPSVLTAA